MVKPQFRGFSSNKQVSVDNLQERSFVALRQIDDYIKAVNGSLNVKDHQGYDMFSCNCKAEVHVVLGRRKEEEGKESLLNEKEISDGGAR